MDGAPTIRTVLAVLVAAALLGVPVPAPAAAQAPAPGLGVGPTGGAFPPVTAGDPQPQGGATSLSMTAFPSGTEALAAWTEDYEPGAHRVHLQRVAADGTPVGVPTRLAPMAVYPPVVAWHAAGGQALLVTMAGTGVVAQRIGEDLQPVGAQVTVSPPRVRNSGDVDWQPSVAFDATAGVWIVAWLYDPGATNAADQVLTRTVDATGGLGTVTSVKSEWMIDSPPKLSTGGPGALVVWSSSSSGSPQVHARRLAAGVPVGVEVQVSADGVGAPRSDNEGGFHPDAAWDGERWGIAWNSKRGTGFDLRVRLRRMAADGTLLAGETLMSAMGAGFDVSGFAPRIAALPGEDELVVTWNHDDGWRPTVYAQGVDGGTGALLDGGEEGRVSELDHPSTDVGGHEHAVAALPGSDRFVVAFRERHEQWNEPWAAPGWPGLGVYARPVQVGVAPRTTITARPQDGHRSPNGSIAFTSSVAGATFACRQVGYTTSWGEHPWQACTSPLQITGMHANGHYGWEVRATEGGWTDATPARAFWTTGDFAAPVADLLARVPRLTTARIARFVFSAYEDGATMECSVDGGARFDCTSGRLTLTGLALGDHTLRIWAKDTLGNEQPVPTSWTWTVFSIEQAAARSAAAPAVSAAASVRVPGTTVRAVTPRRSAAPRRRGGVRSALGVRAKRYARRARR